MKIKIISQDYLNELKSNLTSTYKDYGENIKFFLESNNLDENLLETKYEFTPFNLDQSEDKAYLTDFENVKKVYSNLMFLSNTEASDERLWSWFSLDVYWEYVQYRWKISGNHNINSVKNHFFFGSNSRRSFTRNAIARLWWIGRLTYDSSREDPFELTEFVCESQDVISHILERNLSNNTTITRSIIEALKIARDSGKTMNTNDIAEIMKYMNFLGATYIIDFQTEDWIIEKTIHKIEKIWKEKLVM